MAKLDSASKPSFRFQDLMLHRVYEILLVASPYDAYILEEDGQLAEQIINEYLGMSFTAAPRLWHVSTAADALKIIHKRKFDMIILMTRIADMDPITFSRKIRELYPKKPIFLLAADESELSQLPPFDLQTKRPINKVFIWTGNANLFPTLIKYYEDRKNVKRDVRLGGVRIIIVIEDTPRDYSVILPMIYKTIVEYTNQLMSSSLNAGQRLLHLRGRPKIILTSNYEQAQSYYRRFRDNVLGIISDINFPKGGKKDPLAGVKFAKWVRKQEPTMPIMLQSRDEDIRNLANEMNAQFLYKNSTRLLRDIQDFIITNFGFGDFIFRTPKGEPIAMAANIDELVGILRTVSDESFIYHANNNHFSNWLSARGEFLAATKIRPLQVTDFKSVTDHRNKIIEFIEESQDKHHDEELVDFSVDSFNPSVNFIRFAAGSLGGKARGLTFAGQLLADSQIREKFPGITIRVPQIAIIGTDEFDRFMNGNQLWGPALALNDNEAINQLFLDARFSKEFINRLKIFLSKIKYPLAIRSSSLLEDSQYQPLAGLYTTFMYPNSNESLDVRIAELRILIKLVYASMFHREPRAILANSTHRLEEEKMAVVIQELIGQKHGNHFYPTFSGVCQNYNYYPVSYMKREEGVAFLALGLGRTVVEGEKALRFSPKYPAILPQFYSIKSTIAASQNSFYALRMDDTKYQSGFSEASNLAKLSLSIAEDDGELKHVASVVCAQDTVIRDSLSYAGVRVVTFAPILKWRTIPLSEILNEFLEIGRVALGGPVEIEFAVNIYPEPDRKPEFCLLQIRPMHSSSQNVNLEMTKANSSEIVARSNITLGDGTITNISDIIYVDSERFQAARTVEIAREIETFNQQAGNDHPYILIGPGRWGSADPWLGIPVRWDQISNAKVIVEVGLDKYNIDPSFGSHFFQIVTGMKIAYFTINPKNNNDTVNWHWLAAQPPVKSTDYIHWIRTKQPISVHVDGISGVGIIQKPSVKTEEIETMDEMESTGI